MTVEPNAAFLDGETPTVVLAGKEWPIPLLTPRQQKRIMTPLFQLVPVLARVPREGAQEDQLAAMFVGMSEQNYDLMLTVVFWGLKKAHPDLTRDEFEDMPITPIELINALAVVSRQTGILKKRDSADMSGGDESLGEAQAAGSA